MNQEPKWTLAVPPQLDIGEDQLLLRIDIHKETVLLHSFDGPMNRIKLVDPDDVVQALTSSLQVSSGLLPPDTLWWSNTSSGPIYGLWCPGRVRVLALRKQTLEEPSRYSMPVPGCVFVVQPGLPPWVFAAKGRPTKPKDRLYRAPFFNVFADGRVCSGTQKWSVSPQDIPQEFFTSFFSKEASYGGRSQLYPQDLEVRWETLVGEKTYPMDDLVEHSTLAKVMGLSGKTMVRG